MENGGEAKNGKPKTKVFDGREYERISIYVPVSNRIGSVDLSYLGAYDVIVASPPWSLKASAEKMTAEEIASLIVPAAEKSALYLWCPPGMLEGGIDVMRTWGYHYVNHQVWDKIAGKAVASQNFEMHHELLLYGRRGGMRLPARKYPSIVRAKERADGLRPGVFYEQIERAYPRAKRIELFADIRRRSWDHWSIDDDEVVAKGIMTTLTPFLSYGEKKKITKTLEEF